MARAVVLFVVCVAVLGLLVSQAAAGSINDVEHIVIWMQENRAFDHYYGTLRGVRGFNDPAAPPLPNGKPVWYQPVVHQTNKTELCGCSKCNIEWTPAGELFKSTILGIDCPTLAQDLMGAIPPVKVTQGELCETLLQEMYKSTYDHLKFSSFFKSTSTCPTGLKVSGLKSATEAVKAGEADAAPTKNESYILPFNLQFDRTAASCMPAPEMDYHGDTGIFNGGLMDAWNTARAPGFGMAYFNRTDLPYYYALADSFTVGDQYYQSTFTATNPNRLHLFSGSNGLAVPNSGYNQLDDSEPKPGFTWETMAETLQAANVSWQVIQMKDNFDDNAFAWFASFNKTKPGEPLWDHGLKDVPDLVDAWTEQVTTDSLPSVTWIVGPADLSEHATNHPAAGEDLSHRLIEVLGKPENADVYAKTVFILNYDEGGQFFDHHWTPTPPRNASDGKSTVSVVGELTLKEQFGIPAGNPIGLGFRVPLFIISPWTRGDYTFSQISDHTSVVKFIEQRFGVHCPNISPWRRAVTSDLLAAFDWDSPNMSWPTSMPSTANNVNASKWQCEHLPKPTLPLVQSLPSQEPGTRKARSLPYQFNITDSVDPSTGAITINMANTGAATGVFYVYNMLATSSQPRKYTVEPGKALDDTWLADTGRRVALSLHGPNGFVRQFKSTTTPGSTAATTALPRVHLSYDLEDAVVHVHASGPAPCAFTVTDNAYGLGGPWEYSATAGPIAHEVPVAASGNWYDFTVTASGDGCGGRVFSRRFMGHLETGKVTTTDPAMGRAAEPDTQRHPVIPDSHRIIEPWTHAKECATARGRQKDACWGYGAEQTGAMGNDGHQEL